MHFDPRLPVCALGLAVRFPPSAVLAPRFAHHACFEVVRPSQREGVEEWNWPGLHLSEQSVSQPKHMTTIGMADRGRAKGQVGAQVARGWLFTGAARRFVEH